MYIYIYIYLFIIYIYIYITLVDIKSWVPMRHPKSYLSNPRPLRTLFSWDSLFHKIFSKDCESNADGPKYNWTAIPCSVEKDMCLGK